MDKTRRSAESGRGCSADELQAEVGERRDDPWSFRVLAEAITDPVSVWVPVYDDADDIIDLRYEFANEAAARMVGVPAAELVGRRMLEIAPSCRDLGLFERYRQVALTGEPTSFEVPWIEDGNISGSFQTSVSPMGDGLVSVGRNVTDRVIAERRLRESELRYRTLVTELPIPAWLTGPNGVVLANDACAELVGVDSAADLVGTRVTSYLDPESPDVSDRLEHWQSEPSRTQSFEVIARLPSGRRHVQMYRRVMDVDDEIMAMWAAIDVTQRVEAEAELARAAEVHAFLADNASELLLRLSSDGDVRYASPARSSALGPLAARIEGTSLLDVIHPEDRAAARGLLESARSSGTTCSADVRLAPGVAEPIAWVSMAAHNVDVPDGGVEFHVSLRDVSDRRAVKAALAAGERSQRLVLEAINEAVVVQSPTHGVVRANRAATLLLGVVCAPTNAFDQIAERTTIHESDGTRVADAEMPDRRAERSGRAELGRLLELRFPDGTHRWIRVDAVAIDDLTRDAERCTLLTFIDVTESTDAASLLTQSEQRLRLVIESSTDLINVVNASGVITFSSPSSNEVLGWTPEEVVGRHLTDVIHAEDERRAVMHVRSNANALPVRVRAHHADGTTRWLETIARPLSPDLASDGSYMLSSRDITLRINAEAALEQERELLLATVANVHAGVLAVASDGRIIEVNDQFRRLNGSTTAVGDNLFELTYDYAMFGADRVELEPGQRPLEQALAGIRVIDMPMHLRRADGTWLEALASASPIAIADGTHGAVLTLHDVTQLRAAEAELRRLATVDPVTGLPNRRAVMMHLGAAIERQRRTPRRLSVLFLDLDGFKAINDTFGHEAGDRLLMAVANRLKAEMRSGDLIGRHGGDEFIAVLEAIDPTDAEGIAERIDRALRQPFLLDGGVATIGVSVGRATGDHGHTAQTLVAEADAAMYLCKHQSDRHKLR